MSRWVRRSERRGASPEEWAQTPEAILVRAEEDQGKSELEARAKAAIAALPVIEREIVERLWFYDLSEEEVGLLLNLTRAEVRTRERRARRRLIAALAPKDEAE